MNRRGWMVGAVGVVALAFIAGVVVYKDRTAQQAVQAVQAGGDALVRAHAPVFGNPQAKVTIVEFFDPSCETCRAFYPLVKSIVNASWNFCLPEEPEIHAMSSRNLRCFVVRLLVGVLLVCAAGGCGLRVHGSNAGPRPCRYRRQYRDGGSQHRGAAYAHRSGPAGAVSRSLPQRPANCRRRTSADPAVGLGSRLFHARIDGLGR